MVVVVMVLLLLLLPCLRPVPIAPSFNRCSRVRACPAWSRSGAVLSSRRAAQSSPGVCAHSFACG
eukprot:11272345-Alexandrium_andersonii.AAC.1